MGIETEENNRVLFSQNWLSLFKLVTYRQHKDNVKVTATISTEDFTPPVKKASEEPAPPYEEVPPTDELKTVKDCFSSLRFMKKDRKTQKMDFTQDICTYTNRVHFRIEGTTF